MGFLDRWKKGPEPTETVTPHGAVGRGHTDGFLDFEELNQELVGVNGLKTYDKMYRTDGDVRQAVQLVSNPIISGTWVVNPKGGDKATERAQYLAEFVEWALFEVMSPNLITHLSQMLPVLIRSGFCPYETIWMKESYQGKLVVVPRKLDIRLPRTIYRWYQDKFGELVSIVQQLKVPPSQQNVDSSAMATPVANEITIPARDMVYYRLGAEGDNWEGVSLLRPAYKHWYLKDKIERIDAISQEREAMGVPICYPPLGATDDQLDAMETVLANMRSNEQGYIIAPGPKAGAGAPEGQGWTIEILGYDRTGSGRDPQPSLEYHTQKIAAAFISEFLRLGHGQSGARATAQVQAEPFQMSVESLTTIIEGALNDSIVKPLIAYNFPNETEIPELKMSQVDSTSLTQLADYIMKLIQVGAVIPDAVLEAFLRERADLPDPDPQTAGKRKPKDDEELRQTVVTGGGAFGDAQGNQGNPAGDRTKAGKHGNKPTPAKDQGASLEAPDNDTITLARMRGIKHRDIRPMGEDGRRIRHRPLTDAEKGVNLDGIEDYLDDIPELFDSHAQKHAMALAAAPDGAKKPLVEALRKSLSSAMGDCYSAGQSHVLDEVGHLMEGENNVVLASGNVRDQRLRGLDDRVALAASHIANSVGHAQASARLNHGDSKAEIQSAGEQAARESLRQMAQAHGQGSYAQGRHDTLLDAASTGPVGLLYTAVLDDNTCFNCDEADDGIVRAIDDPVRLDRRPPNRHCESNHSHRNLCRCIEIPQLLK